MTGAHVMECKKMVGVGGSAISSMTGQLLTSAEIEEVGRLSCGALDPEFDAEEDAAREMYSQSDLWWAASLFAQDPIPPPRGDKLALDSVSFIVDTIRA